MVMLVALGVKAVLQGQCMQGVGIEWESFQPEGEPIRLCSSQPWLFAGWAVVMLRGCVAVQPPRCAQGGLSVTVQVSWERERSSCGQACTAVAVQCPGGGSPQPLQCSVPHLSVLWGRAHGSGQARREGWAGVFAVLNVQFSYQLQWGQLFKNNM